MLKQNNSEYAEYMAQAASLLQKYESNTVKTNDRFRKKALNSLVYWLSIYTAEQISYAIDKYIDECANLSINQRYMRRSYTFFNGNQAIHGFFELYILAGQMEHSEIQANDCFQSFQSSGSCGEYLKGVLSYCNYCVATNMMIHQTEVLADSDLIGDENASTERQNK